MHFALLNPDKSSRALADVAIQSGRHKLIAVYESEDAEGGDVTSRNLDPPTDTWARLLHDPDCEVVVVGAGSVEHGGPERHADQLRKLVQSGMPLIIVHPANEMLLGFELQMIQRDSTSPIIPYLPELHHPIMPLLQRICTEGDRGIGEVAQIIMDRVMDDGGKPAVMNAFARDALLIRRLVGRIERLSALGPQAHPSTDWANLSVQMTTHNGVIVRWSAHPGPGQFANLTIAGEAGNISCRISSDSQNWSDDRQQVSGVAMETAGDRKSELWPFDLLDNSSTDRSAIDLLWDDACRAVELADTIEASLRRGKTIDLYHEEHTEEETFKGMMAAGGCLALLATLFLLPLSALVESLELKILDDGPWRALHIRSWPIYLFCGLLLFLLLQGFRAVFWEPAESRKSKDR